MLVGRAREADGRLGAAPRGVAARVARRSRPGWPWRCWHPREWSRRSTSSDTTGDDEAASDPPPGRSSPRARRWQTRSPPIRRAPAATRSPTSQAHRALRQARRQGQASGHAQDGVEVAAHPRGGRARAATGWPCSCRSSRTARSAGSRTRRWRGSRRWPGRCTPTSPSAGCTVRRNGERVRNFKVGVGQARVPDAGRPLRGHRQAAGELARLPLRLLRARAQRAPDQAARAAGPVATASPCTPPATPAAWARR